MAVTDDERRRVVKELRDFFPIDLVSELTDVDCHLATMVMGDKFCPSDCLWCFEAVCERLADLIEPSCDRDALLVLADGLCDGYPYGLSHGGLEQLARRIREACGAVDAG